MDINGFRPIGDYVLVQKCFKDDIKDGEVTIYRTDFDKETTNFAQIIEFGPKCKEVTQKHLKAFVLCPERSRHLHRVSGEFFCIKESELIKTLGAFIYV